MRGSFRFRIVLMVGVVSALLMGATCNQGASNDQDTDNGTPLSGRRVVIGQVSTVSGSPIPAVGVTLASGASASTDDYGFYSFPIADGAGATVVARFNKTGFAPVSKTLTAQPVETARPVPVHMAAVGVTVTLDSAQQTTTRTAGSAVTIPGHSLTDAAGRAVTGQVTLTVTHLDPSTDSVLAFPGSFGAARDISGNNVALESFGFASYQLSQDGQPVNLAPGATATIEYVLPDNAQGTHQVGDKIGLWHFDETTATWVETGEGEVRLASDGSGRLAWFAEVPHFSDWNCDQKEERHCITGQVVMDAPDPLASLVDEPLAPLTSDLTPVAGATVIATGISYNGTDSGVTDANGRFCVYAKAGSTCNVEIRINGSPSPTLYQVGGSSQTFRKQIVYVPDSKADCGSDCVEMGTIEIPLNSAVKGRITDKSGQPASNIAVHLSSGASALTDANGEFCAKAPGGIPIYVYADGWSATMVNTADNATCDDGNAADAQLNIPLAAGGDAIGTLTASKLVTYMAVDNAVQTTSTFSLGGTFLLRDAGAGQSFSVPGATVIYEQDDPCAITVYDTTYTYRNDEEPPLQTPGAHALDPGTPGLADNGSTQVQLLRDDGVGTAALWRSGYYGTADGVNPLALGFNGGQTVQFQFPGGADIGAFSASVTVPAAVQLTSPGLGALNTSIDLKSPLHLTWIAGNSADTIRFSLVGGLSAFSDNGDDTTTVASHSVLVECDLPDTGDATLASSLLARIPPGTEAVTLLVYRVRENQIDVPLKRTGGTAKLKVVGESGVSRSFFTPPD